MLIHIDKEFLSRKGKTRDRLENFFREHEGQKMKVNIYSPKRSTSQNSFYWAYLGLIETETGQDVDSQHEYYKRKFLKPKYITVFDDEIMIPRSTTELSTVEFGDYLDRICALSGVPIPDPRNLEGFISNY